MTTRERAYGVCCTAVVDRWEWFINHSMDRTPHAVTRALHTMQEFLASYGIPVNGFSADLHRSNEPKDGSVTAQIMISATAGAVLAGGPGGTGTPATEVPDLAVIIYDSPPYAAQVSQTRVSRGFMGAWEHSWDKEEHLLAIEDVRERIARGEVYQVNLVGHRSAPYTGDVREALHRISQLPHAIYGQMLHGETWSVASASPELFLKLRDGVLTTRPIKGTAPATPDGKQYLHTSEKERAEHTMIVDLMRHDVARVSQIGSVRVPEFFALREWRGLWQAESSVVSRVRDDVTLVDLLTALMPPGSVTGAPKIAALGTIAELEPVGRGPAMGAIGWVSASGIELGVSIRTLAAEEKRVHLWAGGGITFSSDATAEVAEAHSKAEPLIAALSDY